MVVGVTLFLNRTRAGLILKAVGDNHDAAHAIGYRVVMVRMAAIAFGGACAGLGGAYLSIVQTPLWVENMTAGRGWIALAIVVFSAWRPARALMGAYLFGGVTLIQLHIQGLGIEIASQYLSMLPYLVTILVLTVISYDKTRAKLNAPACLGRLYEANDFKAGGLFGGGLCRRRGAGRRSDENRFRLCWPSRRPWLDV